MNTPPNPLLDEGYSGCLATDGFSVFAASATTVAGKTILSKFATHPDPRRWYSAECISYTFPKADRLIAAAGSGVYLTASNCGRVCCDGTHVWIIKTTSLGYKNILVRVPLYSIID